jgi:hypothetical protein
VARRARAELSSHRAGLIAGVAGAVLLIAMLLPWFGPNAAQEQAIQDAQEITQQFEGEPLPEPDLTENAWQAFTFVDLVLAATGLIGVLTGVVAVAGKPGRSAVGPIAATAGLGILSSLLVLHRVINPIGEAAREYGLFVGFFAALAVAVGGWLALEARTASGRTARPDSLGSRRDG